MSSRRPVARPISGWSVDGSAAAAPQRGARGAPSGGAASPRPVIRGESGERKAQAIVDWLRFTFLPVESFGASLEQIRQYLALWFSVPVNMVPSSRGFRGYESSHDVVMFVDGEWVRLGFVACGGAHVGGTMCVDLSGKGCGVVTDWMAVFATMRDLDARITRCDLAMDFLAGEVRVDQVEAMYFAGEFNCGGRIPSYRRLESGSASSKGCGGSTFEIGRRANGKLVRAYEKGRQLGKQDSEWVRVEIEFGNKDRVIPHEIVLKCNEYFVGAHKALEQFLEAASLRCRTDQVERGTTIERALKAVSAQWGKYFDFFAEHFGGDFAAMVSAIRVEGVPASLQKSALARRVWGAHDPAPVC